MNNALILSAQLLNLLDLDPQWGRIGNCVRLPLTNPNNVRTPARRPPAGHWSRDPPLLKDRFCPVLQSNHKPVMFGCL